MKIKDIAIKKCLEARKFAIARTTYVGACIYTKDKCFIGFNIENRSHKGYHAEEVALLNCYLNRVNPDDIKGIVISYGGSDDKLTFACGHCRQVLWGYTCNPELLISEIDIKTGKILDERTLGELLPIPYPHIKWGKFIKKYRR